MCMWSLYATVRCASCAHTCSIHSRADNAQPVDASGMQVYDNLSAMAARDPVPDNYHGSYLTMLSKSGFIFGIINVR